MITYGTIIECLWFVLSKILLLYASNNFSEMIVWWQNNMRLQCKIISLKWTVWLALDITLKTPQGPNTYLHYIPRDPITFISEWDLMGEVMAGKGLSKKKGRAPELPLLLQILVPETLKSLLLKVSWFWASLLVPADLSFVARFPSNRRLHIKNCSDGSTISELEQPRQR